MKNKVTAEAQITWKINSGNISFWWDDWLGDGNFASNIWNFFSAAVGVQHVHIPLRSFLMRWWRQEYKNEVQRLLIQLPLIILWNLWKNRCAAKYGTMQSNTARVKFLILKDAIHLLSTDYPYIQSGVAQCL
ncbi:hypothetical protein H5410_009995 [Solanum commersonii]|uniref:Reverse transcriptase zinc-binding domain-containing protein n=1 Tax=Solanum commersonii TaxID=4109 RepID=A0A9J6AK14_SOLCO|nr:hypothetical protein H5410_009995 [Solanum commersonii]